MKFFKKGKLDVAFDNCHMAELEKTHKMEIDTLESVVKAQQVALARLCDGNVQKSMDLAGDALIECSLLVFRGIDFRWEITFKGESTRILKDWELLPNDEVVE